MKKALPYIAIVMTVTFWGISYISSTICLRYTSPITLVSMRSAIAAIILFTIWKVTTPKAKIMKKDYWRFLASGFLGMNCYFICEVTALKYISPSIVVIIVAAIPIFTLLIDRIFMKTKLTFFKIVGVVVSLVGVALIISSDLSNVEGGGKAIGYLFALGAVLSWVIFNYVTKPLYADYKPLTITAVQMAVGALSLIPFFLLSERQPIAFDTTFIFNLLFLALLCSATAMLLYMYALSHLSVFTTTLFINVPPLITVAASALILKQFLSPIQFVGGFLVIMAVYVSNIVIKKKEIRSE
jgi:drug/metabolite transporter (DMT)-like permease